MKKLLVVACVFAVGMAVTSQSRADITVTSAETRADVSDASTMSFVSDSSSSLAGATVFAMLPGFSSTHTSAYSSTALSNTFSQTRLGFLDDYSFGHGFLYFTANANDAYSISGSFTNSDGFNYFHANLYDVTNSAYLFYNVQYNFGGTTQSLGNTSGNYYNDLQGSLTGSLTAGNQYFWQATAYTQAYPSADTGATASGSAMFQLNSIPEPSSLAFLAIAGFGIMLYRRRKK